MTALNAEIAALLEEMAAGPGAAGGKPAACPTSCR